jgi:cytochrome c-type biogenesis protein CcsB
MTKKLCRFLCSIELAIVLLLIFVLAQIFATLGFATDAQAWQKVYGTRWFEALLWLLGVNISGALFRYKTYKKLPIFVLHLAIIVILTGSAITRYAGYGGILHLRLQEASSSIILQDRVHPNSVKSKNMGFSVRLDRFVAHKYPGSTQPSSYDSYVTVIDKDKVFPYHIYMNHILTYKGYRIYQMSYDMDEKGSILFVNKDPGIFTTYFGYFLLTIGFLWSMFYKKSRFMKAAGAIKLSALAALFFIFSLNAYAIDINSWANNSKDVSRQWSKILIQFSGRIEPMDTFDMDVVHKIAKKAHLGGMDYNQIVAGMISYPYLFQTFKMIYVGNDAVRKMFNIKGKYAAYNDFFLPNGDFKFKEKIREAMHKAPSERNDVDRELLKVNERVYIAYTIYTASAFKLFPTQLSKMHNYNWYSVDELKYLNDPKTSNKYFEIFKNLVIAMKNYDTEGVKLFREKIYDIQKTFSSPILPTQNRIKAELIYNHLSIFPFLIGVYSLFGIVIIFFGFFEILKSKIYTKLDNAFVALGWLVLIVHTANMFFRWYISGHLPWSDAYESIIFIAWSAAFVSLVFFRRFMLALGAGFFVSGMFMMVAHLNSIDPQITNMVPVLKSYWLLIHVAVITIGYGFLAVSAMLALLNLFLFLPKKNDKLHEKISHINKIIYIAIYAGLAFLSIGTFLGGVWANESWGRYWSWDPKETWSLITIIAYAVVLHMKIYQKNISELLFTFLSFLSFFFILMTYFGVNFYIAQGLHSYGRGEAGYEWFYVLKFGIAVWFAVVVYAFVKNLFEKNIID